MQSVASRIRVCAVLAVLAVCVSARRLGTQPSSAERLDTWVQTQAPFDPERVKVRIIYSHVGGDKPIDLPLPSPKQLPMFTELRVTIDGKDAERQLSNDYFDA